MSKSGLTVIPMAGQSKCSLMRLVSRLAILALASIAFVFGQLPDLAKPPQPVQETSPVVDPAKRGERPLTPAELRDQQIRLRDPLSKANPALEGRESTQADPEPAPLVRRQPTEAPLPGSIAESNLPGTQPGSGPRVAAQGSDAPGADYAGPAVLSRSYTISRPTVPKSFKWTPTLGFTETYDTGLALPALIPGGAIRQAASLGYGISWAISGQHAWKHDLLGLDYHGDMNRYGGNSSYNGVNQALNLSLRHLVSRRLALNYTTTGSIQSRNSTLLNPLSDPGSSVANTNLAASPTSQILDDRVRQWQNQLGVVWQKSSRLSFNAGAGLFFVDRTGFSAIGNSGYQAQADVNYRMTRKTTVGLYYSFTTYTYSHQISVADFHTLGGIYSYALNRGAQIRLRAGVSAIESQGQQVIMIDPQIAALLGQAQGIVEFYSRHLTSDISAQFVKDLGRRRTASVSYARGLSPGNGQMLTSTQESLGAQYSMRLFRSYRLDLSAGRLALVSVNHTAAGKYDSQFYSGSLNRTYRRGMNGFLRVDYRTFNIPNQPGVNNQVRISTGITWDPPVENWLK